MKTPHCNLIAAAAALLAIPLPASRADEALDAQIARGKTVFATCAACHGMDGKGLPTNPPMAPPLVGSKLAAAPAEVPVAIVLRGIAKTDAKYLNIMAPLGAAFTDEQLADVLTYVRNSWGNKAPAVTAGEVKAVRAKYKDTPGSPPRTEYEKLAESLAKAAGAAAAPAAR